VNKVWPEAYQHNSSKEKSNSQRSLSENSAHKNFGPDSASGL
jgi:hypothetical protein